MKIKSLFILAIVFLILSAATSCKTTKYRPDGFPVCKGTKYNPPSGK